MHTKTKIVEVTDAEMWTLLLSSVRYALRRRTYITALTSDIVLKHKHRLQPHQRRQIAREVHQELEAGQGGDDCDIRAWRALVAGLLEDT